MVKARRVVATGIAFATALSLAACSTGTVQVGQRPHQPTGTSAPSASTGQPSAIRLSSLPNWTEPTKSGATYTRPFTDSEGTFSWSVVDANGIAISYTPREQVVFGEADQLPGLIIDRYDRQLVVQFTAAGVEAWREFIVAQLPALTGCTDIYERSDASARERERLALRERVLAGTTPGGPTASALSPRICPACRGAAFVRPNTLATPTVAAWKTSCAATCPATDNSIRAARSRVASFFMGYLLY